jgi:hypothetical protein
LPSLILRQRRKWKSLLRTPMDMSSKG